MPRQSLLWFAALPVLGSAVLLLATACSPGAYKLEADKQVYGILRLAAKHVTGTEKEFRLERPVDNLRRRLLARNEAVVLKLTQALDVAAENSRDYQRQKEVLYQAGLTLTREQHDFAVRFGGGHSTNVNGIHDDNVDLSFRQDLQASMNTTTGGRLVANFVNNFMRDLLTVNSNGRAWDASTVFSLTFTQPLMRGAGRRIAREPLTQAERNVIFAMRTFERFRATFAVRVVSDYYGILSRMDNLVNSRNNHQALIRDRKRMEALVKEDRQTSVQLDQAKQSELVAENRVVTSEAGLESTLDRFKITLGLPADSKVTVDKEALKALRKIEEQAKRKLPDEKTIVKIALAKRFDYQTILDQVADSARRVYVAEDALRSFLDFDAAMTIPTEPNKPIAFDWERVSWSAGFDLDLALDRLNERNSYRQALINLDQAIRARENLEDQIKQQIRQDLRDLTATFKSYEIQTNAVKLADRRVRQTEAFLEADRGQTTIRDVLEAKDSLLSAQLQQTQALVDYAISRLSLLTDMEALVLDEKGLRFDQALPFPDPDTIPDPRTPPKDADEALQRMRRTEPN